MKRTSRERGGVVVDHPGSGPVPGFTLRPAYGLRELAREVGWDPRKLRRILAAAGVRPRRRYKRRKGPRLVWISDLRNCMPEFLDSWAEIRHQRELASIRAKGGTIVSDRRSTEGDEAA